MRKNGRDLQRLITSIERVAAAGRQGLKVESPAFLIDKITRRRREHDVVLRYRLDHHEVVMALECRDRARPVTVEAVEAFHTKCQNTGIHRRVMVSSRGFTKQAAIKADFYDIRCLSLAESENFEWCPANGIETSLREILHTYFYVQFPIGTDLTADAVVKANGEVLSPLETNAWANAILEEAGDRFPITHGKHQVRFYVDNPSIFIETAGGRVKATRANFKVDYLIDRGFRNFTFRRYADAQSQTGITDVAIATMPIGHNRTGDLVLSTQDDGSLLVSLVPYKE